MLAVRDGQRGGARAGAPGPRRPLRVRAGDQIVVDGPLLDGRVEADESLLTGESDAVPKEPGDELRSGSLCVSGGGSAARPGRRGGQLRRTADPRRPPRDHRQDPAAAADRVRRPAGDGADRADERGDPGPGRAGGAHPAAGRADHGRAVRAGALRVVLPDRRGLHRGCGGDRRPRRARAAGQRGRVGQQRGRGVHGQDRHADHRATHRREDRTAGRAAGAAEVEATLGAAGPQRQHAEPDRRRAGRDTCRAPRGRSGTRCRSPPRCAGRASPPRTGAG